MSFKDIFKANHLNKLLITLAIAVVIVFIFILGIFVGHEKGRFSREWEQNYCGNMMGPGGPGGRGMMNFDRPGFNPHNGFGQIIKIENNQIIVKGQDNVEKIIIVNDKTIIREFDKSLKLADLKVDDNIIAIGRPDNQGRIEAGLIRVMPAPAANNSNNAATSAN